MNATYARKHKRDATHEDIAKVLEDFGFSVVDTSKLGDGFGDMVVGRNGVTDIIEAKSGENAPFTQKQIKFYAKWRGKPTVKLASKDAAIAWATKETQARCRHVHDEG